jgi:hypothetical protein
VLKEYYKKTIFYDPQMMFAVQTVGQGNPHVPPHSDSEGTRPLNWIYLLDSGGENVTTSWWEPREELGDLPVVPFKKVPYKNLKLVAKIEAELGKWYMLNTEKIHSVEGLSRPRLALICFPMVEKL